MAMPPVPYPCRMKPFQVQETEGKRWESEKDLTQLFVYLDTMVVMPGLPFLQDAVTLLFQLSQFYLDFCPITKEA